MSLLNNIQGSVNTVNNKIKNPFSSDVEPDLRGQDFSEGFIIEELEGPKSIVRLVGDMMPHQPFTFEGEQRVVMDYYAGHSEPVTHVLGPKEPSITIKGLLKDKKQQNLDLYGVATEVQQLIDSIRIRGNLVRIRMGEFQRYGILESNKFELFQLSRVGYEVSFAIIGFNAPLNAKFLERTKEVPFQINQKLILEATAFQETTDNIPDSVPFGVADVINNITSDVASAINVVTSFVDTIVTTTQDIRKAVERAKGLIKFSLSQLDTYKKTIGSFDFFDANQTLTGRYDSAKFYSSSISTASSLTTLMINYRDQFSNLIDSLPKARHFVIQGDTLQKISIQQYGSADNWKEIYDYNNLNSTELTINTLLDIPKV